MADIRVAPGIRVVDLDTGNELDITAAGNAGVDVRVALPAGTNNIGDVDVLTMPGTQVEDAASAGGETGVAIIGVRNDAAASKTSADGDFSMLATDAAGRVGIADLGGSITIDGSVGVTGTVDTELPAAGALADATANPTAPAVAAHLMGFNGTTWDRVDTANTGRLQVDVVTGGGAESPTNPVATALTSAAVAAGASATLDTADIPTKKGWGVDATASVPFKAIMQTVANAVATSVAVVFGNAGELVQWRPPNRNFFVVGGATAGLDALRVVMTNLDPSEAADVYATVYYSDN